MQPQRIQNFSSRLIDVSTTHKQLRSSQSEYPLSPLKSIPTISRYGSKSKHTIESDSFQVTALKKKVYELERELHNRDKELIKLQKINEYLLSQVKNRENMIHEERKFLLKQKHRINDTTSELRDNVPTLETIGTIITQRKRSFRNSQIFDGLSFQQMISNQSHNNHTLESQVQSNKHQPNETLFPTQTLDLKVEDEVVFNTFNEFPLNKFMSGLLTDEDNFVHLLQTSGAQKLFYLYENFLGLALQSDQLLRAFLRLKGLVKAALTIILANSLDEAIEIIIQQSVKIMNCDRASCFILDEPNQQLWSRVAKGVNGVIRVSVKQGVAGHVATEKKLLNIRDAYSDPIFNPSFDKLTQYKTKNILCLPIMKQDQCLGVIQLINKNDGPFTKEDEYFGQILCDFLSVVLSRAINQDHNLITVNKLRQCLKFNLQIQENKQSSLVEKLFFAERSLKQIMNVNIARIAIIQNHRLLFALETGSAAVSDDFNSIMGQCITSKKKSMITNMQEHRDFAPHVDIKTSLPVVCVPLINGKGVVIGAMQVPVIRGLQNLAVLIQPRLQGVDEEVLEAFQHQVLEVFDQV